MNVRHLVIQPDNRLHDSTQTYLIKNTSNNQYIRLGKNETYHLLSVLGANDAAEELNLHGVEEIPDELREILLNKFSEWGFLNENIKEIKTNTLEKLKKIRLIKFNVQKMLQVIYPLYSVFFSKAGLISLICMTAAVMGYFYICLATVSAAYYAEAPVVNLRFSVWEAALIFLFFLFNTFLHEFAHAVTCVKYGGKVTSMGLMLFYLIPCFYCDVSSVYTFQNRMHRAIVAVSGILANLFIGNILLIIAIALSYWNIIIILLFYMAVSTIIVSLYNLVPFVKLDGYWLLQALTGMDNLMDKSVILAYTTIFARKYLKDINIDPTKRRLLSAYGIISLFFHQLFWIYSYFTIKSIINLDGAWGNAITVIVAAVIILDFIKTLQYYYRIIRNDYHRMIMTIDAGRNNC
ncbi:MAG: M50 family metallopeptidase [Clostridia bacterium]|nr:M50 family metallopeptidase [Clostridia bacterium]